MQSELYLLNCWYGLAWSTELDDGALLARKVLGNSLVVFRDKEGRPAALRDRCSHRMAPLSMGKLKDGVVECAYHGMQYDGSGRCVHYPFGPVPARAVVEHYAVVERDKMIWIWPGNPELADSSLIPDYHFHNNDDAEDDWVVFGYTNVKADYRLEIDNLMDLSHAEYLHATSFGGRGFITNHGRYQVRDLGNEIHSNWWMPAIDLVHPGTRQPIGVQADHFLDMRWNAPSNMRLQVGFLPQGVHADREDAPRDDLPGQFSAHIITPEDEGSCHYFWSADRPKGSVGFVGGMDKEMGRKIFKVAFEIEDKPMLEAVAANMHKGFWEEKPLILPNDVGGIRARRRLAKLIREEQEPAGAEAVSSEALIQMTPSIS
ncbi:aromatic ring-hydroxylating dioxygenase subunit alpha [Polymorphobacter megasporae]|uniref:aromatic ring-hydroxylating dioxygenase subunit alpha n=1 Tax=Glacieibacterium megasporae TaxID=2835787 RepID=UPI001C1DD1BB|nr:aromatic ring-hydroxylating dioxygenase subunit alpha [Polymorphobacter megasporae]UAJ10527.1 aromatic ring-hydroxylating dioxygenase subunit alpha [Polymorphobacter megasporae]